MPPILLIPGNMCDRRLWDPIAHRLTAGGWPVVHAPLLDQTTIDGMIDAVEEACDAPSIVVGFSMGAIVACGLADRRPDKTVRLGLIAFNASADLPERAAARPRQQQRVRWGELDKIVADELKPLYLADENRSDRGLLRAVMDMARALGPDAFVAQSEALRLRPDLRPALPRLAMPVLLACGREDRLCPPEWHRRWAEAIGPNARFAEIAGAGHLLPLERPDALAGTLLGWLAEVRPCPPAS